MGCLRGLSGIKKEEIPCEFFRSASAAMKILRKGIGATTANSNGALNIWRDDKGKYRCAAYKYCSLLEEQIFETQKELAQWIKTWLPKIA